METMIGDIIFICFISIVSASISMLLEYSLGLAGKDEDGISTSEIFFSYTYGLAKSRLIREGDIDFLDQVQNKDTVQGLGFNHSSGKVSDPVALAANDASIKTAIVQRAQSLFYWEKAFGMCIYCTNVWISIVICSVALVTLQLSLFYFFVMLLCIPPLSHFILRKF